MPVKDPVSNPVNDIVISGLGLVTPFGSGVAPYWRGLLEGRSALRPADRKSVV